ncbi:13833_t:CDS:2 [Cetraspora pellucida]|uniref:13833_t:CDS:1 n=1 Tax=Cetraspora pellucida TaxID=1433469 RepID=A0ACA9N2J1_9GLOM|nr:13833_t:CDS:2 [Cetraspora pellucida]
MNHKYSIDNISATALMEADLDEVLEMQYRLNNVEFEEMINIANDFSTTREENVDDVNHIDENNVASEDETGINDTNIIIPSEDISKNMTFDTWEEVETFFTDYSFRNGFAVKNIEWNPNKSSETALKGTQRNTRTKKSNCPWHCNLSLAENSLQIKITTIINKHNHKLSPEIQKFGTKYRSLSEEAIKEIELMTKHGNLSITSQRNILKARFPDMIFQDTDLANAIGKIRSANHFNTTNDASTLLLSLMEKKIADPQWTINFELDEDQPGIESTAHVEGYNWIIKKELRTNSTLCELAEHLDQRLKSEAQWEQFHEYRSLTTVATVPTTGHDLFPEVVDVINKYTTKTINDALKLEMGQCLYIAANKIEPTSEELTREQENDKQTYNGFIEDQHDARHITLQAIIDEIGYEDIKEIWKVIDLHAEKRNHVHFVAIVNQISFLCSCLMSISKGIVCCHYFRVMMHSDMAAFHISMTPTRWYKDSYQDHETSKENNIIFNNEKVALISALSNCTILMRKSVTKPVTASVAKKTIDKRNQYRRIWGLAREATQLAVDNDDSELIKTLTNYIDKKKNKQQTDKSLQLDTITTTNQEQDDQINRSEEHTADLGTNIEVLAQESGSELENEEPAVNLVNIQNPSKVACKGRPLKRRYISSIEKEQKQKRGGSSVQGSYKCRMCGQLGHNSAFHKK